MALPPKFAGQLYIPTTTGHSAPASQLRNTIELYLDYTCPFCCRLFNTFYTQVLAIIEKNTEFSDQLQIIFRQQVQPWHPSSTLLHEAAVAVLRVDGSKFWTFSQALFAEAKSFYDVPAAKETRNQTYARLAAIAAKVGVSESEVLKLLIVPDKPAEDGSLNVGNGVTKDLIVMVKMARLIGVHVSPTVLWNGVVDPSVESAWTSAQWTEWIRSKI